MKKLCFIYSSIGGPKLLGQMFSKKVEEKVVYLVYQQMPSDEFMQALVSCLEDEIQSKIQYITESAVLIPGHIYFISNRYEYNYKEDVVSVINNVDDDKSEMGLVKVLDYLSKSTYTVASVVLSGVSIDKSGLNGFEALKKSGAKIYATPKINAPVFTFIEELQQQNLVDVFLPPLSLLSNLEFSKHVSHKVSQIHWLVVDDEKDVRDLIGEMLLEEEITCDFAGDGLDALRKIQTNHYSAMVLDMKMPELDGLKTLIALQTIDPDLPTLVITGYDDRQAQEATESNNVLGMLLKPFTSQTFRDFIPKMVRP